MPYLDTIMSTIHQIRQRRKYEPVAKSGGSSETKRGRQVKYEPLSHFASDTEHCERCRVLCEVSCKIRFDQTSVNVTDIGETNCYDRHLGIRR